MPLDACVYLSGVNFYRYKEFVDRIEIMNTIKTLNHINVRWLTKCRRCCISKYSVVEARRIRKVSPSYRCGCSHKGQYYLNFATEKFKQLLIM